MPRGELAALSLYGAGSHPRPRPHPALSKDGAILASPTSSARGWDGKQGEGRAVGRGKPRGREKGGVWGRRESRRKSRGPRVEVTLPPLPKMSAPRGRCK